MTQQLMARFHEDDVVDALQEVVGPGVQVRLTPPCACCNATIGYARDHRALWVFPQLWPTTLPPDVEKVLPDTFITEALAHAVRVVGFETAEELELFLKQLADKDHFDVCAPLLREAFARPPGEKS